MKKFISRLSISFAISLSIFALLGVVFPLVRPELRDDRGLGPHLPDLLEDHGGLLRRLSLPQR